MSGAPERYNNSYKNVLVKSSLYIVHLPKHSSFIAAIVHNDVPMFLGSIAEQSMLSPCNMASLVQLLLVEEIVPQV